MFADLELLDADERLLKAQLALQIRRFIEQKGWTQSEAAEVIGLDQPKVSNLLRGNFPVSLSADSLASPERASWRRHACDRHTELDSRR